MCKIAPTLTIRAPNTEMTPKTPTSVAPEARIQIPGTADSPTPETLPTRARIKVIPRGRRLGVPQAKRLLRNPRIFGTLLTIGSLKIKGNRNRRSQRRMILGRKWLK
jgi:hypothetical protein